MNSPGTLLDPKSRQQSQLSDSRTLLGGCAYGPGTSVGRDAWRGWCIHLGFGQRAFRKCNLFLAERLFAGFGGGPFPGAGFLSRLEMQSGAVGSPGALVLFLCI